MDLISIARKYRKKRKIIEIILLSIFIIYACIIGNHYIKKHNQAKVYRSYEKIQKELIAEEQKEEQEKEEIKKSIYDEEWIQKVQNIYKQGQKQVFLTFDDGPSKTVTTPILELLKKENIKATFFVLGSRVDLYPEIVKREYEEGHYIANHGYSHTYSQIYASVECIFDEYNKTEDAIKRAIGNQEYTSMLFRFPGGSTGGKYANIKQEAKNRLAEQNIAYVDWNALTGDAEGGKKTVEQLIQRLSETIVNKNNIVILMHDAGDKKTTYEALPNIIANLRSSGYEFKSFYDLVKYE